MKLFISVILIIVTALLNFIFIFLTRKYKYHKSIIDLGKIYRREYITSLNKLWKKQIFIVSICITLCFLAIFIDANNKIVLNTFLSLTILYSFIGIILGIYNYNCFNKLISNLLSKTSK